MSFKNGKFLLMAEIFACFVVVFSAAFAAGFLIRNLFKTLQDADADEVLLVIPIWENCPENDMKPENNTFGPNEINVSTQHMEGDKYLDDPSFTKKLIRVRRVRRDTKRKGLRHFNKPIRACSPPEMLKTVTHCRKWNTTVTCISYCPFGETFDEGIVRTHSCKFKENKWTKPFEECKPFVDCRLRPISLGNAKCKHRVSVNNPVCKVWCGSWDNKIRELTIKNYKIQCQIDGSWKPALPPCAKERGIPLVKAPAITVHTDIPYPEAHGSKKIEQDLLPVTFWN